MVEHACRLLATAALGLVLFVLSTGAGIGQTEQVIVQMTEDFAFDPPSITVPAETMV